MGTQRVLPRTAIAIAPTGQTFDITITPDNVRATRYLLEVPNYTNDVTTTLSFIDENGVVLYAGPAHPRNGKYSIPIDVELVGTITLRLHLSGAAGGSTLNAFVTLLGETD